MQYFTLKVARENTVSSLRVGAAEVEIAALREKISEYMLIVYDVEIAYKDAMMNAKPYPGDNYDKVKREALLWQSIRLHLRVDSEAHRQLLAALEELRNNHESFWVDRSADVISKANAAFSSERRVALGESG